MGTRILVLLLLVRVSVCVGQGHVNFANDPALFVNDPGTDRFVGCIGDGRINGANWAAQLWYGIGVNLSYEQVTMTADPVANFFPPGAGTPGVWAGGDRALPGTTAGINQFVTLEVRVWDITRYPTWLDAASHGAPHGASSLFNYVVPAAAAPADAYVMYGLRGFRFTCEEVPEPHAGLLFAAGVPLFCGLALLARRRSV